ncbi:Cyclopropane-fatty-acyl-phospholipid synthase [hydrothermal vent metagenome]|uniref:Cyclopropane-fatty-acyl-phospholipid synthase n=1 Tax=hydrothermal vent metagenome TaxID=652676 RepID=A0A3B0ZBH5_9ZZZZ
MKNPLKVKLQAATVGHQIVREILTHYHGLVAIQLWDGEFAVANNDATCTIIIKQPGVLRDLIFHRNVLHLAEDYLMQEIDIVGDIECLFNLVSYLGNLNLSWTTKIRIMRLAFLLPRFQNDNSVHLIRSSQSRRANTKKTISHHYDVGNDFYNLWLDKEMVYSCAYFSDTNQTLDHAQQDKLDYICKKLRLAPDQTLLDIGCGWGALICWAAKKYGVKAHGITLSREQFDFAQQRIQKCGLQDRVTVELRSYVDLPVDVFYNRVVSVGMFEHIGVDNFPLYFKTIKRVLAPGGLFLNHGITTDNGWQDTPLTRFINSYVFPDGELARISSVNTAMENAGFEIIDVEGLRRHYALTLRRWVNALEKNKNKAVKIVGEATYRVWRLYMSGSAYHFDDGNINVYQVLAGHDREPLTVSLRRDELYEKACECITN